MNESELAQMVAERGERYKNTDIDKDHRVEFEVPYNNYGSRGVVDMVTFSRYSDDSGGYTSVIELKSDAAIREATGANEILRQFNRMRRNFFEDSSNDEFNPDSQHVSFGLIFAPTVTCVNHVLDNLRMYRSVKSPERKYVNDTVGFAIEPQNENGVGGTVNLPSIPPLGELFMSQVMDGGRLHQALKQSRYECGELVE